MRMFKKFDLLTQITILAAAIIMAIIENLGTAMLVYFFGYLLWNVFSIVVHLIFFRTRNRNINWHRNHILVHTVVITIIPFVLVYGLGHFQWIGMVYLIYTFMMPFYYLWMCFREIHLLDEIHDQVSLIDIGQH